MKKTLIALCALTMTSAAFAGNWNFQPLTHYYGQDGSSYTIQHFGDNQGHYSGYDSNGCYHSGGWQRFGNNVFGYGN